MGHGGVSARRLPETQAYSSVVQCRERAGPCFARPSCPWTDAAFPSVSELFCVADERSPVWPGWHAACVREAVSERSVNRQTGWTP